MVRPHLRPPISLERLRAIQAEHRRPEVKELLWEIKRLQQLAVRCHTMLGMVSSSGATGGAIVPVMHKALKDELAEEPAVKAHQAWTDEATRKPR